MNMESRNAWHFCFDLVFFSLVSGAYLTGGSDTIFPGQSLSGNQTIVSRGEVFELGFFTPGNSRNHYIGMWYKTLPDQTVVWVANRRNPVSNPSSSALKLLGDGNLVLLNSSNFQVWSANVIADRPISPIAVLLDSGNLVVRNKDDESYILWQSFDHPTDTLLPGGKLGYNKLKNSTQSLTSWKSRENPEPGLFSLVLEKNGTSHLSLWNSSKVYRSSGAWTGKAFSHSPEMENANYIRNATYITNENESYYTHAAAPSTFIRNILDVTGQVKHFAWGKDFKRWSIIWMRPVRQCDVYAFCGAYSICNREKVPFCDCLPGFEPTILKNWVLDDHAEGCARRTPIQCDFGGEDAFSAMRCDSFPDNSVSVITKSIEECRLVCLRNCSCNAFAYTDSCLIWIGDLVNLQAASDETLRRVLYFRIAKSDRVAFPGNNEVEGKTGWIVIVAVIGSLTLLATIVVLLRRRNLTAPVEPDNDSLVVFKYRDIRNSTKNFSDKFGEGGCGSVFKGTLPNATTVAVKKLKCVEQCEKLFRAEVRTIGTIQHINLVRLRGFCIKGSERYLVYDYMPNGSLDSLLFKKNTRILDWKTSYQIAIGTARALAYLHEECRECIIHCDIKPENILLDDEYKVKVADFGLAKLFGHDFSRVLTTMRGTRGYLAPEWILGEAITPKVDVFSYGMLLFEIISGKRNIELLDDGSYDYFPFRVASLINKRENILSLLDPRLESNADNEELSRLGRVACWCIQDWEKNRPTMGQVVQTLEKVMEVAIPPIPRFLYSLAENSIYSTSTSSGFGAHV